MLALCPLIPRFDLANPEEMQKTPKETRFNVAIRYGLQQVLLRTEGNYNPALQITREILDKRVANIARRMIIDDMLVEDRLDDAVAVARTIELEQEKDAALEECVICYSQKKW